MIHPAPRASATNSTSIDAEFVAKHERRGVPLSSSFVEHSDRGSWMKSAILFLPSTIHNPRSAIFSPDLLRRSHTRRLPDRLQTPRRTKPRTGSGQVETMGDLGGKNPPQPATSPVSMRPRCSPPKPVGPRNAWSRKSACRRGTGFNRLMPIKTTCPDRDGWSIRRITYAHAGARALCACYFVN